jgi:hypothetical protein
MIELLDIFIKKVAFYADISKFSAMGQPLQVVLAVCPRIFPKLTEYGKKLLFGIILLSLLNTRLFHIFFVLVLLKANLPNEKDKLFWRGVLMFSAIVFLWGFLHYFNETKWMVVG